MKMRQYQTLYSLTTSLGIGLLILELFWLLHYRGGFAWQSQPSLEFNWHPFLMVLGMVFLYSQCKYYFIAKLINHRLNLIFQFTILERYFRVAL